MKIKSSIYQKLIASAKQALKSAYCPYSHYPVGAAILTKSGKIYTGCNIESGTLITTSCAERSAIFHMISHGERTIQAVCTVSKTSEPCGSCRQLIQEFSYQDTPIFSVHLNPKTGRGKIIHTTLSKLLPLPHTSRMLKK